jgi:hypothetical protein
MNRAACLVVVAAFGAVPPIQAQRAVTPAARDSAHQARRSTRRTQVFSGEFSSAMRGPYFVWLYPGITYRLLSSEGNVQIAPRSASLPPIRFTAAMMEASYGAAFQVPETGEYRVESDYTGREAALVRIYREEVSLTPVCGADSAVPCTQGLTSVMAGRGFRVSPSMIVGFVLLPVFLWSLSGSGRRF